MCVCVCVCVYVCVCVIVCDGSRVMSLYRLLSTQTLYGFTDYNNAVDRKTALISFAQQKYAEEKVFLASVLCPMRQ